MLDTLELPVAVAVSEPMLDTLELPDAVAVPEPMADTLELPDVVAVPDSMADTLELPDAVAVEEGELLLLTSGVFVGVCMPEPLEQRLSPPDGDTVYVSTTD
jgi:hypothetical protein